MRVLIIIPAYNEEKSIAATVSSLKEAKMQDATIDYVIVNDGSTDHSLDICEKYISIYPYFRLI